MVRYQVELFEQRAQLDRGYQIVYTPHIASQKIYEISGHLETYRENMYSPMSIEEVDYYLKPMNCPGHIMIYKSQVRSYRDLPIRLAELGTVYRYERSGTLHGMLRVRGFTQDDAHIFCTEDQVIEEITGAVDLAAEIARVFGYEFKTYLATRPEKWIGDEATWKIAEEGLRLALQAREIPFEIDAGGGAFYGPKIDIKWVDALGREWTGPTIQLDFQSSAAIRRELHRRGRGSSPGGHDPPNASRLDGAVRWRVGGALCRSLPGMARPLAGAAHPDHRRSDPVRAGRRESIHSRRPPCRRVGAEGAHAAKIRNAQLQKVPYMLVIGKREVEQGAVAVRLRTGEDLGAMPVDEAMV
jgi:threonyl-tRNA synthetase